LHHLPDFARLEHRCDGGVLVHPEVQARDDFLLET